LEIIRKILHNLSVIVTVFVAGLLITAHLSVLISPEKIWWLAFFGLSFPYLLIANISIGVYWAIKRKYIVLIPLLSIVVGWGNVSAFIQPPLKIFNSDVTSKNPDKIKVLTYNVRSFNRNAWMDEKDVPNKTFQFIKEVNPDIICFQEFYESNEKGYTLKNYKKNLKPYKYSVTISAYGNQSIPHYGIAIFSKFPILKTEKLEFQNTINLSMYANIKINNDTIRVYNNHLQSIRFMKDNYDFFDNLELSYSQHQKAAIKSISVKLRDAFSMRAHQANHLSAHIAKSPYPVIVCGDFNDTPISYTYHKMKSGLYDSFTESGCGIGNSYRGTFPSFRIDYILHSEKFKSWGNTTYSVKFSDHYPVSSYLCLISK
jgi:endonuclease/exonuclease/phosphatase family metal-dependent hydrolase